MTDDELKDAVIRREPGAIEEARRRVFYNVWLEKAKTEETIGIKTTLSWEDLRKS